MRRTRGLAFLTETRESARAWEVGFEGGWLELYNAKGQAIAEVREFQDGPRVALFDANGNTRVSLTVSETGAFAYLFSPDGKQNLRLQLFSSGQASLVMQDSDGNPSLLVATETDAGPVIALMKGGEVFWRVP